MRRIGQLGTRYIRSRKDPAIMTEIERLKGAIGKMPPQWDILRPFREAKLPRI
jgi:hypothetical protein